MLRCRYFHILTVLFVVAFGVCQAQAQEIYWENNFGGSGFETAQSVKYTNDGGAIVVGESNSSDGDVSGNNGDDDFWVVKLDASGNIEWERNFGGSGYDYGNSVLQTSDSGFVVAGSYDAVLGNSDGWVIKLNSSGSIEWDYFYGGSSDDHVTSINKSGDGGFIVGGHSYSDDGDLPSNNGLEDAWFLKLSANGNVEWSKSYGGSDYEEIESVIPAKDGGYIGVGSTQSNNDGDVSGENHGEWDVWLVKMDPLGGLEWERNFGSGGSDMGYSVARASDSGFVVTLLSDSASDDLNSNYGYEDAWVIQIDRSGNLEWEKNIGGNYMESNPVIERNNQGDYLVAMSSRSTDRYFKSNIDFTDYCLMTLSPGGDVKWSRNFGGTSFEDAYTLDLSDNGRALIGGETSSDDGDVSGYPQVYDMWVLEVPQCVVNQSSVKQKVCGSYTVPSGDETYFSSGVYRDTIPSAVTCDSLITIDLGVYNDQSASLNAIGCEGSYTVPSGDETYSSPGTYHDTISTVHGCDSMLTIKLQDMRNNSFDTISPSICRAFKVPSGDEIHTNSGIYHDTIPNAAGCDSILTIDLTVRNSSASISKSVCTQYTVPSGDETYRSDGTYFDTIPNSRNCDSIMKINLDVTLDGPGIAQQPDGRLQVEDAQPAVNYQWLDCDEGYDPILSENGTAFNPLVNGSYAVKASKLGCSDTSDCLKAVVSGIIQSDFGSSFRFYPNPTNGVLHLRFGNSYHWIRTRVYNIAGKKVKQAMASGTDAFSLNIPGASGVYLVHLRTASGKKAVFRVIKE